MTFEQWMRSVLDRVEDALGHYLPAETVVPTQLHEAMRYAVLGGGKRVRPLLCHAAGELTGATEGARNAAAAALEMIHVYSLVHDDMPCMDDDALRRGKPTVHVQYDEPTALLVGDALQSQAFVALTDSAALAPVQQAALVRELALASGSIDAWATWEPYTALAETSGRARVLVSGRGLWSGLSYLSATDAAIAAKRDVLRDFLQRVVRAQAWSYQHADAFSAALARIIGIPQPAARLQFERRRTRWLPIDAAVIAEQQRTADFYLKAGLLRQPLDVRATFDRGFPLPA